jgi:hypothetical protein
MGGAVESLTLEQLLDTGGRYNPTTDMWRPMSTQAAPSPRAEHTLTFAAGFVVVWGGIAGIYYGEELLDGARYAPQTDMWLPISRDGAPVSRAIAASTDERVVFQSDSSGEDPPWTAAYDPAADAWESLPSECGPGRRYQASATWVKDSGFVVWGGGSPLGLPHPPEDGALLIMDP